MTPTQRTLAELKRRGFVAQVVEKWNPHARVRQDLFGCIDIIAIGVVETRQAKLESVSVEEGTFTFGPSITIGKRLIGIQATSGTNHSARVAKIAAEPRAKEWIGAGGLLWVWSWSKRGARGKRKTWTLRVEEIAA